MAQNTEPDFAPLAGTASLSPRNGDRFELTPLGAELSDGDVSRSLRDQAIAFTPGVTCTC